MKVTSIRIDDETHLLLQVVGQLENKPIATILAEAIATYLDAKRSDPALTAQADSILAEIDAAARSRRDAIATLFGSTPSSVESEPSTEAKTTRPRSRKSTS